MAKKLTKQARQKNYLDAPNYCPFCNSEDIEGHEVEICDGIATQHITCECGAKWTDVYRLISISVEQEPTNKK
jgi:transcription elongation factor Elf1